MAETEACNMHWRGKGLWMGSEVDWVAGLVAKYTPPFDLAPLAHWLCILAFVSYSFEDAKMSTVQFKANLAPYTVRFFNPEPAALIQDCQEALAGCKETL